MITINRGRAFPYNLFYEYIKKDFQYIVANCKPNVIFCSAERKPLVDEVMYELDMRPMVVIIDEYESADASTFPKELQLQNNPHETAVIIYTSGTTGNPKGVMLSHNNLKVNIDAVCTDIRIFTPSDRILMLLPLHHIFPLLGTLVMPHMTGGTVILSPSMASEDVLRTLNEHRITLLIGVPRLFAAIHKGIMVKIQASRIARGLFALARLVHSWKFSALVFRTVHKKFGGHIRFMVSGGAALDPVVCRDFHTLGFNLLEGYGMTEASPIISFNRPWNSTPGTPGQALSCAKVEVREGEIVVIENVTGTEGKTTYITKLMKLQPQ